MNLYHLSQTTNTGYDTFDSTIVAAADEAAARQIRPGHDTWGKSIFNDWCDSPDQVTVKLIGTAVEGTAAGVVLASFNAG